MIKSISTQFFQLTLEERKNICDKPIQKNHNSIPWWEIEDSVSMLENIRSYQLNDIFGKYKLF